MKCNSKQGLCDRLTREDSSSCSLSLYIYIYKAVSWYARPVINAPGEFISFLYIHIYILVVTHAMH